MNFVNNYYAKMVSMLEGIKKDERGSQTLEWIGIAAVIVIVVGIISTAFSGADGFGDKVVTKFGEMIDQIGSGK